MTTAAGSAKSGQRLGRYRLGPRLAVGGMAEVFIATADDGREVVLKVLLPQLQRDDSFVAMLEDEATLTERLDHEHLVRTLDHSSCEPSYLVMERVDGCTLAELLEHAGGAALEPALALRVGEALLEALSYIHGFCGDSGRCLDIVHRDISPGNVLLGRDGAIKLADFGIARSLLRDKRTRTGVIKGTVQYMSPEQVAGSEIDRRADLYSVGLLLFEMLTGARYIEAEREIELLSKAAEPTWRAPSSVNEALSKSVDKLLRPALMVFPEQRYRDAKAMLDKLRAVATELDLTLADDATVGQAVAPVCAKLRRPRPSREAPAVASAGEAPAVASPSEALANTLVQQRGENAPAVREGAGAARSRAPMLAIALVGALVVGVMLWRVNARSVESADAPDARASASSPRVDSAAVKQRAHVRVDASAATAAADAAVTAARAPDARSPDAARSTKAARTKRTPRLHKTRRARRHGSSRGTGASASRAGSGSGSSAPTTDGAAKASAQAAQLATLSKRIATASSALAAKGLHRHDLPAAARRAFGNAKQAITKRDVKTATTHTASYERAVAAARLDRALVSAKLKRVERALRAASSRPDAAALRRRASAALQLVMDGRLRKANRQLDALLGSLSAL